MGNGQNDDVLGLPLNIGIDILQKRGIIPAIQWTQAPNRQGKAAEKPEVIMARQAREKTGTPRIIGVRENGRRLIVGKFIDGMPKEI